MRIHLLGGVDTVTGSQHLVEAGGARVLRDCGMFQGRRREAFEINSRLPFRAEDLAGAVLSHAHLDHCGNLPTLGRLGYRGAIHATSATVDLCRIMLLDSAKIQEQDAAYLNQKTNRKNEPPVVPLYTTPDAERALGLFQGAHYGSRVEVAPGIETEFSDAGHILGAALTTFTLRENGKTARVGFAFDLGRKNLPLIRDPELLRDLDAMILESTYGNRLHHPAADAEEELLQAVQRTLARGGKVIIPSFALERAQEVLYHLASLVDRGRLPRPTVYVDSPMATDVTRVFEKNAEYLDSETLALHERMGPVLQPPWVKFVSSVDDSKKVTASDKPSIVISASGMCEHGRILHHLKHAIGNPLHTILIVGFQAENTLGRRLVENETRVRIFGDWFERKAEVAVLNAFSGHADRNELLEFAREVNPKKIFLVHGESKSRAALAEALKAQGREHVFTPARGDIIDL